MGSLRISSRLELGGTFSFSHGAGYRDVSEFVPIHRAREQDPPRLMSRAQQNSPEKQAVARNVQKNVDIFSRSDAAQHTALP